MRLKDARGTQRRLGACSRVEGSERFRRPGSGWWLDYKLLPQTRTLQSAAKTGGGASPGCLSGDAATNSRASKLTSPWDSRLGGESVKLASWWGWVGRGAEPTGQGKGGVKAGNGAGS